MQRVSDYSAVPPGPATEPAELLSEEELALGVAGWLAILESGQLTAHTPFEQRFVGFLRGAEAALRAPSRMPPYSFPPFAIQ